MKVNDQIRARREQLGISVRELAEAVQVSEQAVRHWESGRSSPGKLKARDVERELSFTIDWTEGATDRGRPVGASALISQGDLELMLVMVQLPPEVKHLFVEMARQFIESRRGKPRPSFAEKVEVAPVQAFAETIVSPGKRKGVDANAQKGRPSPEARRRKAGPR